MMEKVLAELQAAVDRPELSDDWSESTLRVYFDAAAFHGLEVKEGNIADIYSYAMEAAEALKPVVAQLEWVNPHHHIEQMKLKVKAEERVKELEVQLAKVKKKLRLERTKFKALCGAVERIT